MAFSATCRLSSSATAASPAVTLSSLFTTRRNPKPPLLLPESSDAPPRRKPDGGRGGRGGGRRGAAPATAGGRILDGVRPLGGVAGVLPDVVKAAAERFGHDHQVVAKWLSGSDLKMVALFGCPSVERRTVFASKDYGLSSTFRKIRYAALVS